MIIDLLLTVVLGVIGMVVSLIPDMSFNPGFMSGFDDVRYLMEIFSYAVPMGVFISCVSVFFLLNNITLVISLANWVIRKIPGIS